MIGDGRDLLRALEARTSPRVRPFRPLTPRQLEVAACVARGLTYRRIGAELHMSAETARVHVKRIALLLPTADGVPAYRRVFLWMSGAASPADAKHTA